MSDLDIYIKCKYNVRIFYYGSKKLYVHFPSKQRCKNIISKITEQYGKDIVFDIEETDKEMLFKFKTDDFSKLEPYLIPCRSGCNISPFSTKNLRKSKYIIPNAELEQYKNIVSILSQNDMLKIKTYTNSFIQTLVNKKITIEEIKADMRKNGLKNKEYIHFIGQWSNYLAYLEKEIYKCTSIN